MLLLFLKAKVVAIGTGAGALNGLAGHFHRARVRPVLTPRHNNYRPGLPQNHLTIKCQHLYKLHLNIININRLYMLRGAKSIIFDWVRKQRIMDLKRAFRTILVGVLI